jgi:hypothetical protein
MNAKDVKKYDLLESLVLNKENKIEVKIPLSYTEGKSFEYFLIATNPSKVLVATSKITVEVSQVCQS